MGKKKRKKTQTFKDLLKKTLRNSAKIMKVSLHADTTTIFLYDKKKKKIQRSFSLGEKSTGVENTILESVFDTGKEKILPHQLAVPLEFKGEVIGVILVERAGDEKFGKKDVKLVQNFNFFFNQIQVPREEKEDTEPIIPLLEDLNILKIPQETIPSIDTLSSAYVEFFKNNFSQYSSGLYVSKRDKLLEYEKGNAWDFSPGTHFIVTPESVIGWVATKKKEVYIKDMKKDSRKFEGNKSIQSLYALPLKNGERLNGVLAFGSILQNGFDKNTRDILRNLSYSVSSALSNIMLSLEIRSYSKKIENLNQFINSIIKWFPSGIITIDKRGNITLINNKAQEILGFSENDAKSITIQKLLDNKKAPVNPFIKTIRENKPLSRVETHIIEKNGKKVPIGFSTSPLKDDSGEVIGAIGIMKELTEIKEIEEGLRREDRLVALGEMAAGMAHEIRNPLAGIKTGVEYLGKFLDEKKKDSVKLIVQEINRLNRIVTDMTMYANRPPIKLDEVKIHEIINIALAFLESEITNKNIEIIKGYDENAPSIKLDGDQIREVFDNVILNAIHATSKDGKIIITTNYHKDVNKIEVRVTDNGVGISKNDKERIFNPFFTTKKGGTGLGLSISYRIIAEHKGDIIITSKEEKGTTVKILLPLNPQVEKEK
jgi:two-component system nitrogen regulation sensor histidine kinase GlnL